MDPGNRLDSSETNGFGSGGRAVDLGNRLPSETTGLRSGSRAVDPGTRLYFSEIKKDCDPGAWLWIREIAWNHLKPTECDLGARLWIREIAWIHQQIRKTKGL